MLCAQLEQETYPHSVAKIMAGHDLIYPEEEDDFVVLLRGA